MNILAPSQPHTGGHRLQRLELEDKLCSELALIRNFFYEIDPDAARNELLESVSFPLAVGAYVHAFVVSRFNWDPIDDEYFATDVELEPDAFGLLKGLSHIRDYFAALDKDVATAELNAARLDASKTPAYVFAFVRAHDFAQ